MFWTRQQMIFSISNTSLSCHQEHKAAQTPAQWVSQLVVQCPLGKAHTRPSTAACGRILLSITYSGGAATLPSPRLCPRRESPCALQQWVCPRPLLPPLRLQGRRGSSLSRGCTSSPAGDLLPTSVNVSVVRSSNLWSALCCECMAAGVELADVSARSSTRGATEGHSALVAARTSGAILRACMHACM